MARWLSCSLSVADRFACRCRIFSRIAVLLAVTGIYGLICFVPAQRATKVDPITALGYE